jgi:hypothetical protein
MPQRRRGQARGHSVSVSVAAIILVCRLETNANGKTHSVLPPRGPKQGMVCRGWVVCISKYLKAMLVGWSVVTVVVNPNHFLVRALIPAGLEEIPKVAALKRTQGTVATLPIQERLTTMTVPASTSQVRHGGLREAANRHFGQMTVCGRLGRVDPND